MAYSAGSAFVGIKPDFTSFQSDVKAEMARQGDSAGAAFGDSFSTRLKASFADLPNPAVKADADTTAATAKLDEAARTRTAKVKVEADQSSLSRFAADVKKAVNLQSPVSPLVGAVGLGAAALGPQALGLGLGAAGIGVGFAAAAADALSFGAVAKGMFSDVTSAQKALTTATDAYSKATTDKARAKALADEKAALAGLTPAERQLATELSGLESAWKSLSRAEQPVVGQAITPWLATATSGMQLLKPLITDGANAVGLLGAKADAAVQSPFWKLFSTTLGTTGDIALQSFGTAAGLAADGLAHLFVTFAPDIDNLLTKIPQLAGDFDQWAKSVTSSGVDRFFATTFSHANLAALKGDLKDLGTFLGNTARAGQSLSPAAFSGLSNVLSIMAKLTPDEIIALTGLFLAAKALGGIGSVAGLAKTVIGLFSGGAAQAAETEAQGTAAGTAAGTSAATAFTSTFSAEVTAALPAVFTEVGATGATESAAAGTAMGTAAATAFGTSFAAEDAIGVTAGLTAVGTEGAAEAGIAGAAIGTALAAGFGESLTAMGAAVAAALPEAGLGAVLAAGLLGAALGGAVGVGFSLGLGASGVSGAAGKIEGEVKAAGSGASSWLVPAGQQAADGFGAGFLSQAAKVQADVGQLKTWTQAGAAGSSTWIAPHGQQAGQGFGTGMAGTHGIINSGAAALKGWVTAALPNPAAWLVNHGVSVMQGFLNGLVSEYGAVQSFVSSVAGWIAANKGPVSEDYKLLQPAGKAIMGGFGDSLKAGFAEHVQPVIGGIAPAVLAGMAGAQSLGALSALGVPAVSAGARLPGVGSPVSGGQLQLVVTPGVSDAPVMSAIVNGLQFHVQGTTGGDVQAALGLGPVR